MLCHFTMGFRIGLFLSLRSPLGWVCGSGWRALWEWKNIWALCWSHRAPAQIFNDCLKLWTVLWYQGRIFAQIYIIWVFVVHTRTGHRYDVTVVIGGNFLVRILIFCWLGEVWNSITAPSVRWYGVFRGDGIGGRLGRRAGSGSGRLFYPTYIVGWYGGSKSWLICRRPRQPPHPPPPHRYFQPRWLGVLK